MVGLEKSINWSLVRFGEIGEEGETGSGKRGRLGMVVLTVLFDPACVDRLTWGGLLV